MNWRPIETAPKDGTPILVWVRKHQEVLIVFYEERGKFCWREYPEGDRWNKNLVTHWQPLPEPPEEEE